MFSKEDLTRQFTEGRQGAGMPVLKETEQSINRLLDDPKKAAELEATFASFTERVETLPYLTGPKDQAWLVPALLNENIATRSDYIECLADGGFAFGGRILEGISIDSQDGRLLSLFLTNPNRFVSDSEIEKGVGLSDQEDRSISFVVRNLKAKLKALGFEHKIVRRKASKGYSLVNLLFDSRSVVPLITT